MKIIRIDRYRTTRRTLREAADVLRRGGVVVMPTETAYGLAAVPSDAKAMRAVFAIKARPKGKPLPFIAASIAEVSRRFRLDGAAARLARKHWPGPLTIVLPYKRGRRFAAAGIGTGAVRVPSSAWARAVAKAGGGIVTSTSANVSGQATPYDPRGIAASFARAKRAPDLMLDAGLLPVRRPSTIIHVKRGTIEVLRQGTLRVKSEKRKEKSST
jgi:L-threonylcarbamoyladenylate synthase